MSGSLGKGEGIECRCFKAIPQPHKCNRNKQNNCIHEVDKQWNRTHKTAKGMFFRFLCPPKDLCSVDGRIKDYFNRVSLFTLAAFNHPDKLANKTNNSSATKEPRNGNNCSTYETITSIFKTLSLVFLFIMIFFSLLLLRLLLSLNKHSTRNFAMSFFFAASFFYYYLYYYYISFLLFSSNNTINYCNFKPVEQWTDSDNELSLQSSDSSSARCIQQSNLSNTCCPRVLYPVITFKPARCLTVFKSVVVVVFFSCETNFSSKFLVEFRWRSVLSRSTMKKTRGFTQIKKKYRTKLCDRNFQRAIYKQIFSSGCWSTKIYSVRENR